MSKIKGTIAILTGGGDVPGLNPAIRAATIRANRNGYRVVGLRNGWEGIMKIDRTKTLENQEYCQKVQWYFHLHLPYTHLRLH